MTKKVLIVCGQEIFSGKNDGGRKGSLKNYKLLQEVFGKENVYLCVTTNQEGKSEQNVIRVPAHSSSLARIINILRGNLFTDSATEETIITLIEQEKFNIIYCDRSMWGSLIKKLKAKDISCKIWVFLHNIEKNYFWNRVIHQNILFYFPYLKILRSEKQTVSQADYLITVTQRDANLLKKIYKRDSNLILPMAFQDVFSEAKVIISQNEHCKDLLFIGTMFPSNYDGIKWFVENVMSELPEYTLKIVGKGFEKKRKLLERKNVHVIGYVDDLEDYYYADNIMVMPIFYGDGIKVKTAEALMYGKIILASNEALEGYDVEGVNDIYRCNTKEEYLSAIKRVFSQKRDAYSKNVRRLFCSTYSLESQIQVCRKIWTSV